MNLLLLTIHIAKTGSFTTLILIKMDFELKNVFACNGLPARFVHKIFAILFINNVNSHPGVAGLVQIAYFFHLSIFLFGRNFFKLTLSFKLKLI